MILESTKLTSNTQNDLEMETVKESETFTDDAPISGWLIATAMIALSREHHFITPHCLSFIIPLCYVITKILLKISFII